MKDGYGDFRIEWKEYSPSEKHMENQAYEFGIWGWEREMKDGDGEKEEKAERRKGSEIHQLPQK